LLDREESLTVVLFNRSSLENTIAKLEETKQRGTIA
jgi:hypothetical protein